jgi:hypothetical protein
MATAWDAAAGVATGAGATTVSTIGPVVTFSNMSFSITFITGAARPDSPLVLPTKV